MIRKKRCLIYAYYDTNGLIHGSTLKLLKEFRKLTDYIFFVSNGKLMNNTEVEGIVDRVIIRENKGYDAGAYSEVLIHYTNDAFLRGFDELILCNSSFWGPFVPLETLFSIMEKGGTDFWGLAYSGKNLVHHLQSYFMVFCDRIMNDGVLTDYFRKYIASEKSGYEEVCREFEIGLSDFLLEHGYICDAYVNNICFDSYSNPYGSLKYDKLPILKKKVFSKEFLNMKQVSAAVQVIRGYYAFDTEEIMKEAKELYRLEIYEDKKGGNILVNAEINQNALLKKWDTVKAYIESRDRIYLLGCGIMMRQVMNHFFNGDNKRKLAGIIATGKLYDITEEELENILFHYQNCSVLICVDDDEIADTAKFTDLKDVFNIWKEPVEFKNNVVNISDTVITAMGRYYYYHEPLAIVDDDGIYCGMLTGNEMETEYTLAEDTTVLAIANVSTGGFMDIEQAKAYAEEHNTVVPVVDNTGKFIQFTR